MRFRAARWSASLALGLALFTAFVAPRPVAAECTMLDPWPSFTEAIRTAKTIVIGQVVEKRYAVPCVIVRVLDPARADFYAARGLRTICPTQTAISALGAAVRKATPVALEQS